MSSEANRLPEANEFSPGQVSLAKTLELVAGHEGDRVGIVEAIRQEYFSMSAAKHANPQKRLEQQRTRAYNVIVGMKGYGLMSFEDHALTSIGRNLLMIQDDQTRNDAFALHILKNCHGIEVLQAVRSLQSRGEKPGKLNLSRELTERGFRLPRATTHHTKLLQWLRTASLLDENNRIDESKFATLTGVGLDNLAAWSVLSLQQKAFLRTLRQLVELRGNSPLQAKEVVNHAAEQYGRIFRDDQLRSQVFRPLEEDGWIVLTSVGPGRGGKSGKLTATEKLLSFDLGLTTEGISALPPELREKRDVPMDQIYAELDSKDTYVKGIALELLAIRVATALGISPVWFRLRAREAGGGEADLVAEGAHLHFSRWLFQCKNTKTQVGVAALAREIGMAVLLRAHVIVLITTSDFSESVVRQSRELAKSNALQVVLVNGDLLKVFRSSSEKLSEYFHEKAEETMRTKRVQLEAAGEEEDIGS